jgi:hypothetical protein
MFITRKVVDIEQVRAEVERHSKLDALMSVLVVLLDPFQRATDRDNARPCWQRAYTPLRCAAEIPFDSQNAVVCNALADVIFEEGPRCQSCATEFGGTPLTEDIERIHNSPRVPFDCGASLVAPERIAAQS